MMTLDPGARALIQDPRIFREGNRVRLLARPPEAVQRMLEAIAGAQRGILLEMYIFDDDEVGRAFADALIERARRGIPVRVMYDSLGSHDTDDAFFDRMQESGV
ncbi:MAG TPA: cardiolipin synthase B, partial [Planctomycetota bacterium]|nr:cardiolipin synthase B [Planctomycetota bacterium]